MFIRGLRSGPLRPGVVAADDDPAMRGLLSHALTNAGYRPHTAMDVREAMAQLQRPGVAAAIVDMLFVKQRRAVGAGPATVHPGRPCGAGESSPSSS